MKQNTASTGTRILTPDLTPLNEDAPLAWFSASRREQLDEAPLAALQTGQTMAMASTWRHAAAAGGVFNQNTVSTAAAWLDTATPDHSVETRVKFGGAAAGVSVRLTDTDNRLYAEIATSGLALYKRVASTVTQLATGGPPVGTMGRCYTIRVDVAGNLVQVHIDGALAITHLLSGGDEVTFAGTTLAGLHARSAAAARFFSAQWWSLTA